MHYRAFYVENSLGFLWFFYSIILQNFDLSKRRGFNRGIQKPTKNSLTFSLFFVKALVRVVRAMRENVNLKFNGDFIIEKHFTFTLVDYHMVLYALYYFYTM